MEHGQGNKTLHRGYGVKVNGTLASGAITDDSASFTSNLFAVGEIYMGGKLIWMGLTTISKASIGMRIVLGGSKNTLKSSVYFTEKIGSKSINFLGTKSLPTLYGKSYTWGTFLGRNSPIIGTGMVGHGSTILDYNTNK
ncbi:hypothetical protein [Flavobacterium sp. '19STA2R22 D10 B1']|uniref:hypothetical protein n=1 Tax=Flavobacterium aerium TaxID=3037261 RepID=UPI00278C61DF|nr:hypothetical protein [Flavobacterium sp. '19STA2R22 D10 B1']